MTARQEMSRRNFMQGSIVMSGVWMVTSFIPVESITDKVKPEIAKNESSVGASRVYMLKDITPRSVIHLHDTLGRKAKGRVAVKLPTGEPGGHNSLRSTLIKDLAKKINNTIVEYNTVYGSEHMNIDSHLKAVTDHSFMTIAKVDITDADNGVALPAQGGKHLKEDFVDSHYLDYDFTVVLSHFKGHAMDGSGGTLKNISISITSSAGKAWVHTTGKTKTDLWNSLPEQDHFLESVVEAAKAMTTHCGEDMLYIGVMNRLSVDCDCNSNPEELKIADIGILASLDPVALDKVCVDLVYTSSNPGRVHLIEHVESRHGIHVVEHAEALDMGNQRHNLVSLDDK